VGARGASIPYLPPIMSPGRRLQIGIACNLRRDVALGADAPSDALAEYDSEDTLEAVRASLTRLGYEPRFLGYGQALLDALRADRPDLVFNIAEGIGGRARATHVPAVLDMLGIPFTHSDPVALGVAQDKSLAKRVVASHGLATPAHVLLREPPVRHGWALEFPVIAKPAGEGSSMGIGDDARVETFDELEPLVRRLLSDYQGPVLVEEFLPGIEFTVAILGEGATARVLGSSSLTPFDVPRDRFVYSGAAKQHPRWFDHYAIDSPPRCDPELRGEAEALALACYRALDCRDVGRVDVRCDAHGRPSFLELNPLPGIAPDHSDLCLIANAAGFAFDSLIEVIVTSALDRAGPVAVPSR
jgi:D-alanine-D-alanine ligase